MSAGRGQKPIVGRREDRGARCDASRKMDRVVVAQLFALGKITGRPDQSGSHNDDIDLGPQALEFCSGRRVRASAQPSVAMHRDQSCTCFGVSDLGADDVVGVQPQTFGRVTAKLVVDQQSENDRGVNVRDHLRCSATMFASDDDPSVSFTRFVGS